MFGLRPRVAIRTGRLILRPPEHRDYRVWAGLRRDSHDFLVRWEPRRAPDHLSRRAFSNRVYWAQRSIAQGTALPVFLVREEDGQLLGAATLDNIQRGPSQAATLGYWMAEPYARQGFMAEAVRALVAHAFTELDLSRIQAACLAENAASRGLLEKCGFKYEGVAQSYLQIDGRWRNHVVYANLRSDRRGRAGPA